MPKVVKYNKTVGSQDVPTEVSEINRLPVDAKITLSADIEIGAVEIKDSTSDARVKVKSDGLDNGVVVIQNSQPLPSGAATETKQNTVIANLQNIVGLEIPAHDYIAITYVPSGNGTGEIQTVVFKTGGSGGTTVATLTLAYDANDNLTSVTKT